MVLNIYYNILFFKYIIVNIIYVCSAGVFMPVGHSSNKPFSCVTILGCVSHKRCNSLLL